MSSQPIIKEPTPNTEASIEATKQALIQILVRLAQEQPQSVQLTKKAA